MKKKKLFRSIKARINTWYAVLMTALGIVLGIVFILALRHTSELNLQRNLITQVEKNADEIEYENGVLEVENGFLFSFQGGFALVLSEDGRILGGEYETADEEIQPADFPLPEQKNAGVTKTLLGGKTYRVYDKKVSFNTLDFTVHALTGKVIAWSSEAREGSFEPAELSNEPEEGNRISTRQAYERALLFATLDPASCTVISAGAEVFYGLPIIHIEILCTDQLFDDVYVRGVLTSDDSSFLVQKSIAVLAVFIPLYIAAAVLIGLLITGRAFQSVNRLSETVSSIRTPEDIKAVRQVSSEDRELAQLTESFNRMLKRLNASFEAEKEFTANASHELRTPIAVILAQCELLLDGAELTGEARERVESVKKQILSMNRLIDDLLFMARLEQGKDHFTFSVEDLSILVRSVCEDIALIADKTVHLDVQENVMMNMDVALMSRLVDNLVTNAVKYGKENGNVWVTLTAEGGNILLTVADDGIGIAPENMEKIFARFFRADKARSRSSGSSGLGLSFVDEICRLHGGRIRVESEPGKGSTFILMFKAS